MTLISIHRSLAGPDELPSVGLQLSGRFQSTGPLRDPTSGIRPIDLRYLISIHRSLAGPDLCRSCRRWTPSYFNPQVPCGTRLIVSSDRYGGSYFNPQVPCGTRHRSRAFLPVSSIFQSTGPLRDPTRSSPASGATDQFQSTGPLRDPTCLGDHHTPDLNISIHRSLAGPDSLRDAKAVTDYAFQSTGPLRDPTAILHIIDVVIIVFIVHYCLY